MLMMLFLYDSSCNISLEMWIKVIFYTHIFLFDLTKLYLVDKEA
jgi:hypothetical protein